jgi:hypothetical protein
VVPFVGSQYTGPPANAEPENAATIANANSAFVIAMIFLCVDGNVAPQEQIFAHAINSLITNLQRKNGTPDLEPIARPARRDNLFPE